jgi:hypothetical protein
MDIEGGMHPMRRELTVSIDNQNNNRGKPTMIHRSLPYQLTAPIAAFFVHFLATAPALAAQISEPGGDWDAATDMKPIGVRSSPQRRQT